MTHKAVGIDTGTIYATGTHQECVRAVNERISNTGQVDVIGRAVTLQHTEAIRIFRAGQHFETEAEYLERMEKEMRLLEIKAEQKRVEEEEKRKAERQQKRLAEIEKARLLREEKKKQAIVHGNRKIVWTPQEIAFLKSNHGKLQRAEMAKQLGKTKAQIVNQINRMLQEGELIKINKTWTDADEAYIIANYGKSNRMDIADYLGVTDSQIRARIHKMREQGKLERKSHKWTEEEDAYIFAHYRKMSVAKMADALGKSISQMRGRINNLRYAGKLKGETK